MSAEDASARAAEDNDVESDEEDESFIEGKNYELTSSVAPWPRVYGLSFYLWYNFRRQISQHGRHISLLQGRINPRAECRQTAE